jgi:cytochrome b involved in lipid metabolism
VIKTNQKITIINKKLDKLGHNQCLYSILLRNALDFMKIYLPIILLMTIFFLLFGCTVNPQDLNPSKNYTAVTDNNSQDKNFQNNNSTDLNTPNTPNLTYITLNSAEVAKHKTRKDCWMTINENVYNLSEYVNHPGGSGYLSYCGTNATKGYDTKDGRGKRHSNYSDSLLANYLVGKIGEKIITVFNDSNTQKNLAPITQDKNLPIINPADKNFPPTDTNIPQVNTSQQNLITLTNTEVAKHKTRGDCWMTINDKIYDLSEYVSHPGGSGYLSYCGTNATKGYDTKGGGRGRHSSYADTLLAAYLIGTLGETITPANTSPNPPQTGTQGEDNEYEDDEDD